jgi:hypothetical protein
LMNPVHSIRQTFTGIIRRQTQTQTRKMHIRAIPMCMCSTSNRLICVYLTICRDRHEQQLCLPSHRRADKAVCNCRPGEPGGVGLPRPVDVLYGRRLKMTIELCRS